MKREKKLQKQVGKQKEHKETKENKHKAGAVVGNRRSRNHMQHNGSSNLHNRSKYSMCADCRNILPTHIDWCVSLLCQC